MAIVKEQPALSLDDVLLRPRFSTIKSRFDGEIDLSVEIVKGIKIKYPLLGANMDTICEEPMATTLFNLGGLGIIHRFLTIEKQFEMLCKTEGPKVLCIGTILQELDRIKYFQDRNIKIDAVAIDTAHGHSAMMLEQINRIKNIDKELPIIVGDVATYDGVRDLIECGANCVRGNVGGGSLCSTRIQTGNGIPIITTLIEGRQAIEDYWNGLYIKDGFKPTLICDGGCKNSGDIIKALAAGADAVMSGNLFAGTSETPGKIIKTRNGLVKNYRGMSSREFQEDWKGYATSVEGETKFVSYKGSVVDVFNDLVANMLSGMSYQNARNIKQLQENAIFEKITGAGLRESMPHALYREG